jgi:hemerythrin
VAHLELTDDLLTGNAEIDRQHRELFEQGNRMLFPTDARDEARAFRHGMRYLASYVREHFAAEESAMRKAMLPGLERHRAEHQRFRGELRQIVVDAKAGGVDRSMQVRLHFLLTDWFAQHLRYWDKQLAEGLREEREAGRVHEVPELKFMSTKAFARKRGD